MAKDRSGKLLIITSSYDATGDLLVSLLGPDGVFRFNTDLFLEYQLFFDASGFTLTDRTGRTCTSEQIYKAYWRSQEWPATTALLDRYVWAELRHLFQEMVNLLWYEGKIVLVEPGAPARSGKLLQLIRAMKYFNVPSFQAGLNREYASRNKMQVVKSFSRIFSPDKFMFAKQVDASRLAPNYPWYMQDYVDAAFDVTVVFVRDRLFAFKLARDFLDFTVDWREAGEAHSNWVSTELSVETCDAIRRFMRDLRLHFGRLDFVMDRAGQLHFCEVNSNAEYAWLDCDGNIGLLTAIVEELSLETERHPIPVAHPLGTATGVLSTFSIEG